MLPSMRACQPRTPLFAEPGRWDRYPYGSRFRDPRPYDRSYWFDADYELYRKESYAYADRWVTCPLLRRVDRSQELRLWTTCGPQLCVGVPGEQLASQLLCEGGHDPDPPGISHRGHLAFPVSLAACSSESSDGLNVHLGD